MARRTLSLVAAALFALAQPACKNDNRQTAANFSQKNLTEPAQKARARIGQALQSMLPSLTEAVGQLSKPMASGKEDDIRGELLDLCRPGQKLALQSFGFVAAVGLDGKAIARNQIAEQDKLKGQDLASAFPAVKKALAGQEAMEIGEFPSIDGYPSAVLYVAAVPIKSAEGKVIGVLAAGRAIGRLAALARSEALSVVKGKAEIRVGFVRGGRVFPSGDDSDVVEADLLPAALVNAVPKDAEKSTEEPNATLSWTFIETGRGWAGMVANLPEAPGARMLIYRSESN